MTEDYNDGKIHGWNGGDCPVHPETLVNTWHRDGLYQRTYAGEYWWDHRDTDGDIIAFRVVKEYVEPKVIWVNEYGGSFGSVWQSEQEARDGAAQVEQDPTRIAVKYVEVKE